MEDSEYLDNTFKAFSRYFSFSLSWLLDKQSQLDYANHKNLILANYKKKISLTKNAITENAKFISLMLSTTSNSYNCMEYENCTKLSEEISKVRTTLRQFVRDWTVEGKFERDLTYKLICDELHSLYPKNKNSIHVLVPGSGLGRLGFDIFKMGFNCQGNENSYYMLIASNFILNHSTSVNEFKIYPWIHTFSNHLSMESQFKYVLFPDVVPSNALNSEEYSGIEFSMAAGDFLEVYSKPEEANKWDCVVTCFFIDTAHNVIEYIEVIRKVLKRKGRWINFGPLLYHFESLPKEMSIELNLQ
jgi:carnosine N-methyltransferase